MGSILRRGLNARTHAFACGANARTTRAHARSATPFTTRARTHTYRARRAHRAGVRRRRPPLCLHACCARLQRIYAAAWRATSSRAAARRWRRGLILPVCAWRQERYGAQPALRGRYPGAAGVDGRRGRRAWHGMAWAWHGHGTHGMAPSWGMASGWLTCLSLSLCPCPAPYFPAPAPWQLAYSHSFSSPGVGRTFLSWVGTHACGTAWLLFGGIGRADS